MLLKNVYLKNLVCNWFLTRSSGFLLSQFTIFSTSSKYLFHPFKSVSALPSLFWIVGSAPFSNNSCIERIKLRIISWSELRIQIQRYSSSIAICRQVYPIKSYVLGHALNFGNVDTIWCILSLLHSIAFLKAV